MRRTPGTGSAFSSVEHATTKSVRFWRILDWGHALVTEPLQRLVKEDVTSDDEGVGLPGAKAVVTFVIVERQLVRVESALRAFKKLLQEGLIPLGMREFAESFCANATDISTDISARSLNIVVWKKEWTG